MNNEGYVNPLGEEKILKLLLKFSIPATVGMVVNALYNIVDRMFIGNSGDLGANGLAGVAISFPIMIILMSIGILFGTGGATLFSIKLGEGEPEEAQRVLGNSFMSTAIIGAIFMVLGQIFLEPILILFGASEIVLPYAMEYMRVILFGSIFKAVTMGLNNFIRADGNPKIAMITMFFGAGLNILLDPLFIYTFDMGMTGAALATVLAQLGSATWAVTYFIGKKSKNKLKLKYMKLKTDIIIKVVSLGLPGFFLQIANSILNIVLNKGLFLYGGDIAVSGMGIVSSLQTMLTMPITGINQGAQPIISFNFGAKKYDRVKSAAKLAIIAATVTAVIGYIITRLFSKQLIGLFNDDLELIEFGSVALKSWFLCVPVVGFQVIASNFFQAIGRPKSAIFLTLTRQVILLIPAIIIFPKFWGIEGLLHAGPFSDLLSALLTGIWFYYGIKSLSKKIVSVVE